MKTGFGKIGSGAINKMKLGLAAAKASVVKVNIENGNWLYSYKTKLTDHAAVKKEFESHKEGLYTLASDIGIVNLDNDFEGDHYIKEIKECPAIKADIEIGGRQFTLKQVKVNGSTATANKVKKGFAIQCDAFFQTENGNFKTRWSENPELAYVYKSETEAEQALKDGIKKNALNPKHFEVIDLKKHYELYSI